MHTNLPQLLTGIMVNYPTNGQSALFDSSSLNLPYLDCVVCASLLSSPLLSPTDLRITDTPFLTCQDSIYNNQVPCNCTATVNGGFSSLQTLCFNMQHSLTSSLIATSIYVSGTYCSVQPITVTITLSDTTNTTAAVVDQLQLTSSGIQFNSSLSN